MKFPDVNTYAVYDSTDMHIGINVDCARFRELFNSLLSHFLVEIVSLFWTGNNLLSQSFLLAIYLFGEFIIDGYA